jgi:hypothetical protein
MLTRDKPGCSSYGVSFKDWYNSDSSGYFGKPATQAELKKAFHKFNNRDLLNRCEKINQFQPDLTVIIHFNVDEKNNGWKKPSNKNFNMIFIGGSLHNGDLNIRKNRMEFLRMLISEDIECSLKAGAFIIKGYEEQLKVKTAGVNDATYLSEKSVTTPVKGVYARNLALTRLIHGPLVYGETLYQDDLQECLRLNKKELEVGGIQVPSRLNQVADAYFQGISNYFKQ